MPKTEFAVHRFVNRTGAISWRVTGWLHGVRIRRNFETREEAAVEGATLQPASVAGAVGFGCGNHGIIKPGDVQWMTAGSGLLHEEKASAAFRANGGGFELIQLWVNLPKRDKFVAPRYQSLNREAIPTVKLTGGGNVRVVAGEFAGVRGPAVTFTPATLLDVSLNANETLTIPGHQIPTAAIFVRAGELKLPEDQLVTGPALVFLARAESGIQVHAQTDATFLVIGGQPIDEPIVGAGPFVMNSSEQIRQAYADARAGRFGRIDKLPSGPNFPAVR
jgi:redox-sensitive bicupin YhaK (pirin superfamily)